MTIQQSSNFPWERKHDEPGNPLIPSAPKILYPNSLKECIEICSQRNANERLKAAGSHWSLSKAAVSDHTFIETNDPYNQFQAMGRTLYEVVPNCLNENFIEDMASKYPKPYNEQSADENEGSYFLHFETGKRVYQLYSELDYGDQDERSLAKLIERKYGNSSYLGEWALQTMGGAGGQTVFGALTTGTHGGDIRFPPMADSVVAIHLVADGGKHYWIEPQVSENEYQLTEDAKLNDLYGREELGGINNFEIIRDNNIFNSVLVSAGRFGLVYSIVIRCVRQYSLHEERRLSTWQDIKEKISDLSSDLYSKRFLQIAVCATPHEVNIENNDITYKNLCGITKRWNVPLTKNPETQEPSGRQERRGRIIEDFDAKIQGPRFESAGNSTGYNPNPREPNKALPPNFLGRACSNAEFMDGVIEAVYEEINKFVEENKVVIGSAVAAVVVVGGAVLLLAIVAAIAIVASALFAWLENAREQGGLPKTLGESLNAIKDHLLGDPDPDSNKMAARIFYWQCIAYKLFELQQGDLDFEAISYAVLEQHDYFDLSCNVNVDSIEVFFDATDPMLVAFVDALLAYEIRQEYQGKAMVGYISLRFMGPTRALLGMAKYERTCAVEVAGLKDVEGTKELIEFAMLCARNKNFNGILHWGQRNGSSMNDIQERFGDSFQNPSGALQIWRNSLSYITENGRLDGFSSKFTHRVGLEIVSPKIKSLKSDMLNVKVGQKINISWDCSQNPPGTEVNLEIFGTLIDSLPLASQQQFEVSQSGSHSITLVVTIRLNGEERRSSKALRIEAVL